VDSSILHELPQWRVSPYSDFHTSIKTVPYVDDDILSTTTTADDRTVRRHSLVTGCGKKAAPNLYAGEQRSGQKRGKHKTLDGIGDQAYIRRSTIMGNDLYPDLLESHSNCSATGYSVRLVRQRRLTSGRKVRRVKDMRNMRAVPHDGNPLGAP
jgi:hypothetical protein